MKSRVHGAVLFLAAAAHLPWCAPVYAQSYPEKAVRFIVPFAPGGSTDFLARLLGQKFTEAWRQPVLVDNRGGGGGTIGADLAAKAPPDGYKGTAPALTDLISGQVSVSLQPVINAVPNAKVGRIRILAVTGPRRSPTAPEVPTMMEAGVPQYNVVAWYGVHAPARTPKAAIDTVNREMVRALGMPDVRERLLTQGLEPAANTPEQFTALVASEVARWSKVIRDAGIKPD